MNAIAAAAAAVCIHPSRDRYINPDLMSVYILKNCSFYGFDYMSSSVLEQWISLLLVNVMY
jgi:hypothetical protein